MAMSLPTLRPADPAGAALGSLADHVGAAPPAGAQARELRVTGVTLSSRDVVAGDLFAALPGSAAHGARFAADAVAAGAAAVLTDPEGLELLDIGVPVLVHADPRAVLGEIAAEIYGRPSERLRVADRGLREGILAELMASDGAWRRGRRPWR